jgi:hypothetical protein
MKAGDLRVGDSVILRLTIIHDPADAARRDYVNAVDKTDHLYQVPAWALESPPDPIPAFSPSGFLWCHSLNWGERVVHPEQATCPHPHTGLYKKVADELHMHDLVIIPNLNPPVVGCTACDARWVPDDQP